MSELSSQSNRHRVELVFDDGVYAKLICPDDGRCEPVSYCASCGRDVRSGEGKPCYDCRDNFGNECWVKGWFDNLTVDELLAGRLVVEIEPVFDRDTCTAHIVGIADLPEETTA